MCGAEGLVGGAGHGIIWGGGDMDGAGSTQDGFGARQESRCFIEGNSFVEVDRGRAA